VRLSCRDALPPASGLAIETSAVCNKRCHVSTSGGDAHRVVVRNRGLLPYEITISGTCQDPEVAYLGGSSKWTEPPFKVLGRSGHCRERTVIKTSKITSVTAGAQPTIRTVVTFAAVGRPAMPGVMDFQVHTT